MFQFVLALIVGVISVGGGSLLWPRLTSAPRPEFLQKVHDVVIQTPIGNSAAVTLGVSDEANVQPLNIKEVAGSAASELSQVAQKWAQTIIMTQVTRELGNQYEKLPEDQKEQLQQIICKPPEASKSAN